MSLLNKINELRAAYNADQKNVVSRIKANDQYFKLYAENVKGEHIQTYLLNTRNEYKNKLSDLLNDAKKEYKNVFGKVQSIKFPNLMDSDLNKKNIGESQATQAQVFLNTPKKGNQIIGAINKALTMERYDFAFTIIDSLLDVDHGVIMEPAQRNLMENVQKIYDESDIKPKVDVAKKELVEAELSEKLINDFANQIHYGNDFVALPELAKQMNPEERQELLNHAHSYALVESIAIQRIMDESINQR